MDNAKLDGFKDPKVNLLASVSYPGVLKSILRGAGNAVKMKAKNGLKSNRLITFCLFHLLFYFILFVIIIIFFFHI